MKIRYIACLAAFFVACGSEPPTVKEDPDNDGDGYPESEDCRDFDRFSFPGAIDPCDGVDNDCDAIIDEAYDQDMDGYTSCGGDCADNDPAVNPSVSEVVDGIDNDCDGIPDNNTDQFDDDGDGFTEQQGDCNDNINTGGQYISPRSIEIPENEFGGPDLIDDDCDGTVDESPNLGDCPTPTAPYDAMDYANAIGVCTFLAGASLDSDSHTNSRAIVNQFGDVISAPAGNDMIVLSTGLAGDAYSSGFLPVEPGTSFGSTQWPHPDPFPRVGCSPPDPTSVKDYTDLQLELDVPSNAFGVSFDFYFLTSHFSESVCTTDEDTFAVVFDSLAYQGNVAIGDIDQAVNPAYGTFPHCDPNIGVNCIDETELAGTGYDQEVGAGTGWLRTTAPVEPGEKLIITFSIFEETSSQNDSTVLIDNFQWVTDDVFLPETLPVP